ncbi:hypothetical protein D6D01_07718 [Aureobasidium pullulans]|uniref:Uncharacterized protein n=1 Tax=Aureobasidium pullulans TaxID=5580 RepID=A0A4S9KKY6_AURPU|nr:hypothetical protein D6D01_07718 [Aureobasidium pullulans]
MTRRHLVNNPERAEASRQIGRECRKRGYYSSTDAYDEKGLPRKSECSASYRKVQAYYGQQPAHYGSIDAMPVLRFKHGVVTIQWATARQYKRQQRIANSMTKYRCLRTTNDGTLDDKDG